MSRVGIDGLAVRCEDNFERIGWKGEVSAGICDGDRYVRDRLVDGMDSLFVRSKAWQNGFASDAEDSESTVVSKGTAGCR